MVFILMSPYVRRVSRLLLYLSIGRKAGFVEKKVDVSHPCAGRGSGVPGIEAPGPPVQIHVVIAETSFPYS